MTIKGISNALSKCNLKKKIWLSEYKGCRIAIDMPHLMYVMKATWTKNIVDRTDLLDRDPNQKEIEDLSVSSIVKRLERIRAVGVIPVCVFDGKSHELRRIVRQKRDKEIKSKRDKLDEIRRLMLNADIMSRAQYVPELKKYYSQIVDMPYHFTERVMQTCQDLGYPTIKADTLLKVSGDAEGACAMLNLIGNQVCDLAYCNDYDYHLYGGNNAITKMEERKNFDTGLPDFECDMRSLKDILVHLDMSFLDFRTACIISGTDYNESVPRVAFTTACKIVRELGESWSEHKTMKDKSDIVNYDEVNIIFSSSLRMIDVPMQVDWDSSTYQENILRYNINSESPISGFIDNELQEDDIDISEYVL